MFVDFFKRASRAIVEGMSRNIELEESELTTNLDISVMLMLHRILDINPNIATSDVWQEMVQANAEYKEELRIQAEVDDED